MSSEPPFHFRLVLLAAAFASLAFGVSGGLLRLGWNIPLPAMDAVGMHGPLMVSGFLGTLISLERAVALRTHWAFVAPLASGLGGIALVAGLSWQVAAALITLGSVILASASTLLCLRHRTYFLFTLLLGSGCWLIGNLLWLAGLPFMQLVPWWIGFLVLTIAGERLELSRMLPPSAAGMAAFTVITALLLTGAAFASRTVPPDMRLFAATLLMLAGWLFRHDIARQTIRQHGLTRFIAACLLSGYVWLLVAGLLGLLSPMLLPGSSYDAFLHAIFVGFVFSMIFGHAPIIFTALARARVSYHPVFYLPLVILHLSLAARLAGDLLSISHCRSSGGLLNAIALLLFVAVMAAAVLRGRRPAATRLST